MPMTIHSPIPKRRPVAGDVYVFTTTIYTPSGGSYQAGDFLEILQRTEDAPFGLLNAQGNYLCRTKLGDSVWSSIQDLVSGEHVVLSALPEPISPERIVPPTSRYEREVL